jgi:hypothetical protein
LPISVTVNVSGVPGTSDTIACANQSPRQRLFGFEDAQSWSSTSASLSLVTTPLTQGCAALGVSGSGFMSIAGAPFSARGLPAASSMTTDLFIPGNQPNPFWLGALQAHVSCPTANAFDVYIGQVELTGKPVGRFSTLTFLVPTAVRNLLQNPSNSCSFRFGLNVNPTGRKWVLDNLTLRP